jgi:hypothetical protein
MCNWEYSIFFATTLRSRNERMAAITVGTMCMIRRRALEEAGGWAEWCVTEDSELAPRIHALGYSSVYVNAVFGRGLIPDTFAGYKKQRFRWTFGPVQELKRHFRLFLPRRWATPSALRPAQKVHHLSHGLDHVATGLGFLLAPLGLVAAVLMVAQREVIHVPGPVWVAMTVALPARWLLQWVAYRTAVGCSFGDMIGALIASHALGHTLSVASVRAMCTERIPWVRTSKFKALPAGLAVLGAARTELAIGLAMTGSAAALLALAGPAGLTSMLLLAALFQGSTYFAAPVLALLAEREVRSGAQGAGAGVNPSALALAADELPPAPAGRPSARPIASTWRWSVPQHPPTTDSRGNAALSSSYCRASSSGSPASRSGLSSSSAWLRRDALARSPGTRSRHAPPRSRAPARCVGWAQLTM